MNVDGISHNDTELMDIIFRKETPDDYLQVARVIKMAFCQENEAVLVEKLRKNPGYNPNLSIVADYSGHIIGHLLFFPIVIRTWESGIVSLALAPLSISPEFQRMKIGGRLIQYGLRTAENTGYTSVIVLGHPEYYSRFGFAPARKWGIGAPFEVSEDALMGIELKENALMNATGVVEYPVEFTGA